MVMARTATLDVWGAARPGYGREEPPSAQDYSPRKASAGTWIWVCFHVGFITYLSRQYQYSAAPTHHRNVLWLTVTSGSAHKIRVSTASAKSTN